MPTTILRPTSPTNQNWPNVKIFNFHVFHPIWMKFGMGLIMGQKQHRMSLKCLRLFFDLPARPTKIDQYWKILTSVFFVRFGWNLVWGLIMNQKQHRLSLKWLRPFFDLPTNHNRPIDVKLTPIPSRTIITIIFLLNRSDILVGHFGDRHLGKRHLGKRHLGKRHFESQIGNQKWKIKD